MSMAQNSKQSRCAVVDLTPKQTRSRYGCMAAQVKVRVCGIGLSVTAAMS